VRIVFQDPVSLPISYAGLFLPLPSLRNFGDSRGRLAGPRAALASWPTNAFRDLPVAAVPARAWNNSREPSVVFPRPFSAMGFPRRVDMQVARQSIGARSNPDNQKQQQTRHLSHRFRTI